MTTSSTTSVSVEEPSTRQATISWYNINVFTNLKQKTEKTLLNKQEPSAAKHILKHVSGVVRPGEFLAIMGASGAGKTTLLNVLTQRNLRSLAVTGTLSVNGRTAGATDIKRLAGYVQQDDLMLATLTVLEHLKFQAALRMSSNVCAAARLRRVAEVIEQLGLSGCRHTVIGDPSRGRKGISGGEMKRLAFACEIITDPPLLFCDEPTSGLDSFMAQNVVNIMKTLAHQGKTIICSIHQPSSEVYALFDRVLFLAEGRVACMGRVDAAYQFFKDVGYGCPRNCNPADFFIQTLAVTQGSLEAKNSLDRINRIANTFRETKEGQQLTQRCVSIASNNDLSGHDILGSQHIIDRPGWWRQFTVLLHRSIITNLREPVLLKVRGFQTIVIALLFGMVFMDQQLDGDGVMNINGVLFLLLTNVTFQTVYNVINVFSGEMPIFLREHAAGMYRTDVYFTARSLAEAPLYLFLPAIFVAICYFMIGLQTGVLPFLTCCGIVVLVTNTVCSFGYMTSCISGSVNIALVTAAPAILPFLLFGGFFLNRSAVPWWLRWLQYLSWFSHGNEALCINQWSGVEHIECADQPACPHSGEQVLQQLNFSPDNFTRNIGSLVALMFGYRLVALAALAVRASRH